MGKQRHLQRGSRKGRRKLRHGASSSPASSIAKKAPLSVFRPQSHTLSAMAVATNGGTFVPKLNGLFSVGKRILTLGDGDLSFSLSLASAVGGKHMTATVFDNIGALNAKYSSAKGNIRALRELGANTLTRVDATELVDDERLQPPAKVVVMCFPHVGGGSTQADVDANREMLDGLFSTAPAVVSADKGRLVIALRHKEMTRWGVGQIAESHGWKLCGKHAFDVADWPGYTNQRTMPAVRQAPEVNDASFFVWRLPKKNRRSWMQQYQISRSEEMDRDEESSLLEDSQNQRRVVVQKTPESQAQRLRRRTATAAAAAAAQDEVTALPIKVPSPSPSRLKRKLRKAAAEVGSRAALMASRVRRMQQKMKAFGDIRRKEHLD